MLFTKLTKLKLPLSICLISALFTPTISQATTDLVLAAAETGPTAASKAADQKEALAKKTEETALKKAASEAQKAAKSQLDMFKK